MAQKIKFQSQYGIIFRNNRQKDQMEVGNNEVLYTFT